MDFACWWSCIEKGQCLQPAQQSCLWKKFWLAFIPVIYFQLLGRFPISLNIPRTNNLGKHSFVLLYLLGKLYLLSILYLYWDERRDIPWNTAWTEENPEGEARWTSRGFRLYFTVYPDSSHNTEILNYNSSFVLPERAILKELILRITLAAGAIFFSILPALLVVYW